MADAVCQESVAEAAASSRSEGTTSNRWLYRYALLLVAATLFLLFAGAMVTSTGSGLAVPDWPTTYGQNMFVFPYSKWVGGIFYEHGHRLIASGVGLLTIGLTVLLWRREPRCWMKRLGVLALILVISQGVLGGLTVKFLLPAPISVSHAGLAELFFCTLVSIAVFLSPSWRAARPQFAAGDATVLRRICLATTILIYAQILMGAVVRHTESGLAIPDFPLSYGRVIPAWDSASVDAYNQSRIWDHQPPLRQVEANQILVHYLHRVGAAAVLLMVSVTVVTVLRAGRGQSWLRRPALLMMALVAVQIALGALTVLSLRDKLINSIHVVVGASLLGTSLVLTLRGLRLAPARSTQHAVPRGVVEGVPA